MAENLEGKVAQMDLKGKGKKQKGDKSKQEKKKKEETSSHPVEVRCGIHRQLVNRENLAVPVVRNTSFQHNLLDQFQQLCS